MKLIDETYAAEGMVRYGGMTVVPLDLESAQQELLPCCTACGLAAYYIGTTNAGTVWICYEGQTEEERASIVEAFVRYATSVGHADVLVEQRALRGNGIVFDCSTEQFLDNRIARLATWRLVVGRFRF